MSDGLKGKMLDGGLWVLGGRLTSAFCAFALNLILARALSQSDYGAYFVALNTIVILATVATVGMDQVVVKFAATALGCGNIDRARYIIGKCATFVVCSSLVTSLGFYLISHWFFFEVINMPALTALAVPLCLWLVASTIQRQLAESCRGLGDIRAATIFSGVRNNGIMTAILTCFFGLVLYFTNALTLKSVFYASVLCSLLVVITATIALYRKFKVSERTAEWPVSRPFRVQSMLHGAAPLWLSMLVFTLRVQSMGWFASAYDLPENVALLGVAQRVVILFTTPLLMVNSILPPVVASMYAQGEVRRMGHVVQAINGLVSVPCILLLLGLIFGGRDLLGLLFGHGYTAAYGLMIVLCVGQVANMVTGSWQVVLPMTGMNAEILFVSTLEAFLQIAISWAGAYYFGVMGVVVGFSVSSVIGNIVGALVVRSRVGVWTLISFRRSVLREAAVLIRDRIFRVFGTRWKR